MAHAPGWMAKTRDTALSVLYIIAAIGCFGLSIYSIWLDRAGSAGVSAAFAVAFLLLRHLPIIESFKAFNVEAKFARRVDEFDRLLAYVRSTAEASSRLLYTQLGYSNRMTSIGWGRKRELMAQLDQNLIELGVDATFISDAKRPVLNFAAWDLYAVFRGTAQTLLMRHLERIATRMNEIQRRGPMDAGDKEWNDLNEERLIWQLPKEELEDMAGPTRLQNVHELIVETLNRLPWTPAEQSTLRIVGQEVEALVSSCWEAGTVTTEAEEFIERYGNRNDDRLKELEGSAA